jgi:hypothetical protein
MSRNCDVESTSLEKSLDTSQHAIHLTFPQRRALGELVRATAGRTAKSMFVRSDVLWRLEEQGLVARNFHQQWRITQAGEAAYEAAREAGWPD